MEEPLTWRRAGRFRRVYTGYAPISTPADQVRIKNNANARTERAGSKVAGAGRFATDRSPGSLPAASFVRKSALRHRRSLCSAGVSSTIVPFPDLHPSRLLLLSRAALRWNSTESRTARALRPAAPSARRTTCDGRRWDARDRSGFDARCGSSWDAVHRRVGQERFLLRRACPAFDRRQQL